MIKAKITEQGSSLLELVVAISIAAIISTALASNVFRQTSHYFALKQTVNFQENTEALARIAERIMQDFDTHPLSLLPKIHTPGQTKLADGSAVVIARLSSHNPAISTIRLRYDQLLAITEAEVAAGSIRAKACRKFISLPRVSPVDLRQALLLHPDFIAETLAEYSVTLDNPDCYLVTLRSTVGLYSTQSQIEELKLAKVLIPIEWIRTYFADDTGNLRVAGHVGKQVIFNQPIYRASESFEFDLIPAPFSGHYQLITRLFKTDQKFTELVVQHQVPRVELIDLTLNLR